MEWKEKEKKTHDGKIDCKTKESAIEKKIIIPESQLPKSSYVNEKTGRQMVYSLNWAFNITFKFSQV